MRPPRASRPKVPPFHQLAEPSCGTSDCLGGTGPRVGVAALCSPRYRRGRLLGSLDKQRLGSASSVRVLCGRSRRVPLRWSALGPSCGPQNALSYTKLLSGLFRRLCVCFRCLTKPPTCDCPCVAHGGLREGIGDGRHLPSRRGGLRLSPLRVLDRFWLCRRGAGRGKKRMCVCGDHVEALESGLGAVYVLEVFIAGRSGVGPQSVERVVRKLVPQWARRAQIVASVGAAAGADFCKVVHLASSLSCQPIRVPQIRSLTDNGPLVVHPRSTSLERQIKLTPSPSQGMGSSIVSFQCLSRYMCPRRLHGRCHL